MQRYLLNVYHQSGLVTPRGWDKNFKLNFSRFLKFEERQVTVFMEPGDQRFGFSVIGGVDEGFVPRVDDVAKGI